MNDEQNDGFDANTDAFAMQAQLIGWMQQRVYSRAQMADVLQCSARRMVQLLNGEVAMMLSEASRVLHHAGLAWPRLQDLPVVREVGSAPKVWAKPPRRAGGKPTAVGVANTAYMSTIGDLRAALMAKVPLPVVEDIDPQHPLEDIMLGRLHRQRTALVKRAGSGEALVSYAAQLSLALAVGVVRAHTGAQQLDLERFYIECPDALRTPYDDVCSVGGNYTPTHAASLHSMALAQVVAE